MTPNESPPSSRHAREQDVDWGTSKQYPVSVQDIVRWKFLISRQTVGCPDAYMGTLELRPGTYPFHAHPAPEVYYVIRGTAQWTVDAETFEARPGSAIYHPPHARHKMVNNGPEIVFVVWFWWAPDGRTDVLRVPSRLAED